MAIEPCLCGDPCCPRCGSPGTGAWEAAIDNLIDELDALGMDEFELELFKTVGLAALNAHRIANRDRQARLDAEKAMYDDHRITSDINNNAVIVKGP